MQTKRSKVTEKDVERWTQKWLKLQKEGNYLPWLEVREVPSTGRSRKVKGIKTGHTHHLLSDLEYYIYLMLEYDPTVTAIYEQFPLLPREDSIEIANEMGIRHPVYPQSSTPIVLTTDFVFDQIVEAGKTQRKAITAKYKSALDVEKKKTKRTLHKIELEKLVHAKNGIELKCVTEECINRKMVYNLKWFIQDAVIDEELKEVTTVWQEAFLGPLKIASEIKLSDQLKSTAKAANIDYETSVRLYRHCMWNQLLKTDITEKIELTRKIKYDSYQKSNESDSDSCNPSEN